MHVIYLVRRGRADANIRPDANIIPTNHAVYKLFITFFTSGRGGLSPIAVQWVTTRLQVSCTPVN